MLEINNVSITVKQQTICSALDLCIKPNEVWGILGPNGCGKSTLLHAIAGLIKIDRGAIHLHQKNINLLPIKVRAQLIAILLQETAMHFPQSVREFCLGGRYPYLAPFQNYTASDHAIVAKTLVKLDLHALANRNIQQLSGGEKRRLSIASVLVQTPQLYLLDEPTNHLDIRHQIQVLKHFRALVQSSAVSVIMSLHDINLAQTFCDYLILMGRDGKLQHGKVSDMLTSHNLTMLYQQPMKQITGNNIFWYAEMQ